MTKRGRNDNEELSVKLDELIDDVEILLRTGETATTSRVLVHLDTVLWEVVRMADAVREAPSGVVTTDDLRAFKKAFGRIQREAETLTTWLRFTPIELPRN